MESFLDVETEGAPEFTSLPDGTEVQLRLLNAEIKNSKAGDPMLAIRYDVPEYPYAKDINHFIMLPNNDDDAKRKAQKQNRLKDWKAAHDLPPTGPISIDDMEGAKAWAILGEEDSQDFGKQNRIKRFVISR